MELPIFRSTIVVTPVVRSVGASPPSVRQTTGNEAHELMTKDVPSSMSMAMDWPDAHVPAVGVLFPVRVHV